MTALDHWLATEPAEVGAPERRPHESTYQYHLRWWLYWSTRDAKKGYDGTKKTSLPGGRK